MVLALGLAWGTALFWLAMFWRLEVTNPLLYWLPLGPIVSVHFAMDLNRSSRKLDREVEDLSALRYKHKEL